MKEENPLLYLASQVKYTGNNNEVAAG